MTEFRGKRTELNWDEEKTSHKVVALLYSTTLGLPLN